MIRLDTHTHTHNAPVFVLIWILFAKFIHTSTWIAFDWINKIRCVFTSVWEPWVASLDFADYSLYLYFWAVMTMMNLHVGFFVFTMSCWNCGSYPLPVLEISHPWCDRVKVSSPLFLFSTCENQIKHVRSFEIKHSSNALLTLSYLSLIQLR